MIKNILLTSDFSDTSKLVFPVAKYLQEKFGAKIHLAYVIPTMPYVPTGSGTLVTTVQIQEMQDEALKKNKESRLEALNEMISENFNGNAKAVCLYGDLDHELEKYVIENKIDFCIMATEGENSIDDKLFGTNTLHAIRNLSCPVFTLPKNHSEAKFQKMLLAIDLVEENFSFLLYAKEFAQAFDAELELVLVEPENFLYVDEDKSQLHRIIEELNYPKVKSKIKISDDVIEAVGSEIKDTQADIIIFKTHTSSFIDRLFHRSLTLQALNEYQKPMLTFNNHFNID